VATSGSMSERLQSIVTSIGSPVRHVLRTLFLALALLGCFHALQEPTTVSRTEITLSVEPWSEAEGLFTRDIHWLGGDGASSVDLGRQRILWLFGDSFVNPGESRQRKEAVIIRNSVAIQKGSDPTQADIQFYWAMDAETPAPFFQSPQKGWYWPGGGIMVDGKLLIFLMVIHEALNDLGFEAVGWSAISIENPHDAPPSWRKRVVPTPNDSFGVIIGSGGVLYFDGYLYAFGVDPLSQEMHLVRWSFIAVHSGDLSDPHWWTGYSSGWIEQSSLQTKPPAVFSQARVEFTVHYEPYFGGFLHIQSSALMTPGMEMRFSPELTGPWSAPRRFFRVPEADDPSLLIYAGKAHPALTGGHVIFTYAVNTLDEERLLSDQRIYVPRLLKGTWRDSSTGPRGKGTSVHEPRL